MGIASRMPLLTPDALNAILTNRSSSPPIMSSAPMVSIAEAKNPMAFTSSATSIESKVSRCFLAERIPAFGLLVAFLSVFSFSIASVIVRIETSLPAIEILVIRSSLQFVVYLTITLVCGYRFMGNGGHRLDIVLRSISGTISLSFIYLAYRMIPLSDASTIHFASPVFVTVFAYFLLKEPFTKLQIITGAITLTGVIIISKPEFMFGRETSTVHEMRYEGILLAVLASMTAAFSMISLRKLKTTPLPVVVMWYSFTLIAGGSVYLTAMGLWTMPRSSETCTRLVIICVCGVADQYMITLAFKYEQAGPISVVRTFNIVLSFMWEVLLLNEKIELTSVLGACLICSCVIVLTLVKWHDDSPESFNAVRHKLCCGYVYRRTGGNNAVKKQNKIKMSHADSVVHLERNNATLSKTLSPSSESIDSIAVQNTVNSNAILLIHDDDDDD